MTLEGEKDCGLKTPYFVENHTYFNKDSTNKTLATKKGSGHLNMVITIFMLKINTLNFQILN